MKRFVKALMVVGMSAALTTSAFAKTASIKVSDNEMKLDISGFVQLMAVAPQTPINMAKTPSGIVNVGIGDYALNANGNSTFAVNRAQVSFAAQPADKIAIKTSVELGKNFNAANDSRIVDAMVDLSYLDGVTLRVGQFALPIGVELEKSPYDLDFINYTLLTTLYAQRNRGAEIYGDIVESVSYDLGFSNGLADGTLTGARDNSISDSNSKYFSFTFSDSNSHTITQRIPNALTDHKRSTLR